MPEKWDRLGTYNWDTGKYEYDTDEPDVYILASDNGDGDPYGWEILAVVARKVGDAWEYAVYQDSGCSCNSAFDQNPEFYDLAWNSDPQAVLKSAVSDMKAADRAALRVEFRKSLRDLAVLDSAQRIATISAGLNGGLAKNA